MEKAAKVAKVDRVAAERGNADRVDELQKKLELRGLELADLTGRLASMEVGCLVDQH